MPRPALGQAGLQRLQLRAAASAGPERTASLSAQLRMLHPLLTGRREGGLFAAAASA